METFWFESFSLKSQSDPFVTAFSCSYQSHKIKTSTSLQHLIQLVLSKSFQDEYSNNPFRTSTPSSLNWLLRVVRLVFPFSSPLFPSSSSLSNILSFYSFFLPLSSFLRDLGSLSLFCYVVRARKQGRKKVKDKIKVDRNKKEEGAERHSVRRKKAGLR